MTSNEILNDGYLAAYLTDELSDDENREIETFLRTDQNVQKEYRQLEYLLELLAFRHGIVPGEVVKQRLLDKRLTEPPVQTKKVSLAIAASISVALISLAGTFYFWYQWKTTDLELAELTAHNLELAENFHSVNQEMSTIRQELAVLVSPEFSRIILHGTDNAQLAKAVIYWNPTKEEVYLNSANMAALPQSQQYQLWALIDGKPVDAGVFNAKEGQFQIMKNIAQADAFAVTVEIKGGSDSPTLSTMQVYGATL